MFAIILKQNSQCICALEIEQRALRPVVLHFRAEPETRKFISVLISNIIRIGASKLHHWALLFALAQQHQHQCEGTNQHPP